MECILAWLALAWQPAASPRSISGDGLCADIESLAIRHQVAGALYAQIVSHPHQLPEKLVRALGRAHSVAALAHLSQAKEANRLLSALAEALIPVIVLKGWAFVSELYGGDPGRRQTGDLDLLVRPADAERVHALLQALGYIQATPDPWPGFGPRFRNAETHLHETPAGRPLVVQTHWHLLDIPYYERIPASEWFARACPLKIAGVPVLTPEPEDNLVYLCAHLGLHHRYDPVLFRYHDIALLIQRSGALLRWRDVIERAVAWRLVIPLQRTLLRLETLWPGTVPPRAAQAVASLPATSAEGRVHRWVTSRQRDPAADLLISLATMKGVRRRMRFIIEQAFPSPSYMRLRYGRAGRLAWPLAYIQRFGLGISYLLRSLFLSSSTTGTDGHL